MPQVVTNSINFFMHALGIKPINSEGGFEKEEGLIDKTDYVPAVSENTAQVAATVITGTIANPASPSVKITALDVPITTTITNGIKRNPSGMVISVREGSRRSWRKPK